MKLKMKGDKVLVAQARRSKAEVRLSLLLGRFGDEVDSVILHLSKVSAANGHAQAGKRCQITVGRKPKLVRVEHVDADLSVALERAADKAVRLLARALDHEREATKTAPLRLLNHLNHDLSHLSHDLKHLPHRRKTLRAKSLRRG
jgi:ribosome-associated translation inhibitor RaiA